MALLWSEIRRYFSLEGFKKGWSLRVAYVMLQLADFLMTQFAVQAGFEELNPLMRGLLDNPLQLAMFKLIIPLAIALLVPARLLLPAMILLLLIIGFNVKELLLLLYA